MLLHFCTPEIFNACYRIFHIFLFSHTKKLSAKKEEILIIIYFKARHHLNPIKEHWVQVLNIPSYIYTNIFRH